MGNEPNDNFDGMNTCVGMKGIQWKLVGQADKGIATSRAQNGETVSSLKGKKGKFAEHHRKLERHQVTRGSKQNSRKN